MSKYLAEIETTIKGIPCLIGVLEYSSGDHDDYWGGWFDTNWDVLDRKGYKAAWLERKLDDSARNAINQTINRFMQ